VISGLEPAVPNALNHAPYRLIFCFMGLEQIIASAAYGRRLGRSRSTL
jgi:hypothetical protein